MSDWLERQRDHLILLLLSVIINGILVFLLLRPPATSLKIVPPEPTPDPDHRTRVRRRGRGSARRL